MNTQTPNVPSLSVGTQLKESFLNYATYVIMHRALPDIRDGFKPVHRRILHAMDQLSLKHNKSYKKSARIVGDVIGKYHPHGDSSVYEAMVRMAQGFSMRLPLVDGQGNFGSVDGDSSAAMRYTEVRMTLMGDEIFDDIKLDTVDFIPNYDGTLTAPAVLPLRFPNLLINGIEGIAVAMASDIPPHNPVETMNAVKSAVSARLEGRRLTVDECLSIIPAPDFPTGGQIYNLSQMRNVIENGRGSMRLRSVWGEEFIDGHRSIVVTELPYQVNKVELISKIMEVSQSKKDKKTNTTIPPIVEGVHLIRDESDKDGVRLVIEVSNGHEPEIVFGALCGKTNLEIGISYNCNVIRNNRPECVGLIDIIEDFIDHRIEVITRRTICLDKKAAARQHILIGLIKAVDVIDQVIALIKSAKTPAHAQVALIDFLEVDEIQAEAILDMRLHRLTGMQIENLKGEAGELHEKRQAYQIILNSEDRRLEIVGEESDEILVKLGKQMNNYLKKPIGDRMTELAPHLSAFDRANMTVEEDCVFYLSDRGYVSRLPVTEVGTQNRGTRGRRMMDLKKDDFLKQTMVAHSHDMLLAITQTGRVIGFMAYELPVKNSGMHLNNLIDLRDEKIVRIVALNEADSNRQLVMMTRNGLIKSTRISEYRSATRKGGINGISLKDDDELVQVTLANSGDQVISVSSDGMLSRYNLDEVRSTGRNSAGVNSQRLNEGQHIQFADVFEGGESGYIAALTVNGMFKVSELVDYKSRGRGRKGVRLMKLNDKTGSVLKVIWVPDMNHDVGVVTSSGITNRISMADLRTTGRNTSGVKLVKVAEDDALVDCFAATQSEEDEVIEESLDESIESQDEIQALPSEDD